MKLTLNKKFFSLTDRFAILDEDGKLVVDASEKSLTCWRSTIEIKDASGAVVGTVQRKLFGWARTWNVSLGTGVDAEEFIVRRRIFSWGRKLDVIGGPRDGALVTGDIFDLEFEVTRNDAAIASAQSKLLTLSSETVIDVLDEREAIFVCALLVIVVLSKSDDGMPN